MTKPVWAEEVIQNFRNNAKQKNDLKPGTMGAFRFLTLAICGEAGELANKVKKEWRGDEFETGTFQHDLAMELADIRIYLEMAADVMNIDLDEVVIEKLKIVAERPYVRTD